MKNGPHLVTAPPGPRSRELSRRLGQAECPEVTYLAEDFPIFWARASGTLVEDVDENTYLDLTSGFGVASIGHTHPQVVAAIRDQSENLLHGMGDVHPTPQKVALLEKLAERAPGQLGQAILATSGSEAVEAARKTAMIATGKRGLMAFTGAYHGLTYGALEATARSEFRRPFAAQLAGTVTFAPYPYCYRCPFGKEFPSCGMTCLTFTAGLLDAPASGVDEIGAVIIEPVQGRGGNVIPPPGYLAGLRKVCDDRGILLICDEIYTGFGRTGAWFASEHSGVVPDLMTVGKALAGGLPLSACLGVPPVMNRWKPSEGEALHTSTFLGNPLACAAALATLKVMEDEELPERARELGRWWLDRLQERLGAHPRVGEIRGIGLMIGIEMVSDRESRKPAPEPCVRLMKEALGRGLILLPEGVYGNVLGLTPPLTITEEELEFATDVLVDLLSRLE